MNELQGLSFEQLRLVIVVYSSALLPLLIIPYLSWRNKIPKWSFKVYIASFIVCALGWEIWFTYGLWAGEPVDIRRAAILNYYIPTDLNWLLNSLADAGSICMMGIFYVWLFHKRNLNVLKSWHWSVFITFLIYFIGQNIFVEMFLYHDQLSVDKALSWAPLAPTGPWFNPTLFEFNGRTITLQGQLPWIILSPLFYLGLISTLRKQE